MAVRTTTARQRFKQVSIVGIIHQETKHSVQVDVYDDGSAHLHPAQCPTCKYTTMMLFTHMAQYQRRVAVTYAPLKSFHYTYKSLTICLYN